jgi:MFS superfamily sulfate permease-like transporter
MVTVLGIVLTDLLTGVILGLVVGLVIALKTSVSRAFEVVEEGSRFTIKLPQDAHFFARRKLLGLLRRVPRNAHVILDAEGARFVDHDVAEAISDFRESARKNSIVVEVRGLPPPS